MIDPITAGAIALLGSKALDVLSSAVEEHAKDLVKKLFERGEQIPFDRSEQEALEEAYRNALTHAGGRMIDALGDFLRMTAPRDRLPAYGDSAKRLLANPRLAEHLLETLRELGDDCLPDPALLEREWQAVDGEPLPLAGAWPVIAAAFRKGAEEHAFLTPQLREVLNARNLQQLHRLTEQLRGVGVTVRHEQYVRVMRNTFAPVQLANLAPAYAEDPGLLVVSDIFEPQHVRENPPPVEITKDELEKLVREGRLEKGEESELIALLEEGEESEALQRLRFQHSRYTEQPVRPVLEVLRPTGRRDDRNRLCVLTGEPGSGKSTLLRYLLLGILEPPRDPQEPDRPLPWTEGFTAAGREHFPFLIELRDYHFTCESEAEVNSLMDYARYLGEALGYGIDDRWLDRRLREGPALVLFDGLDEIFDPARRDHVMRQIVGFAENYPQARIVVTSRPHGYREGILRPAGFAHYRLQDLDRQQKERFTRAWFGRIFPTAPRDAEQRVERVLGSVDRSPSVRWLAGNPLLLTIMCLIARERELPRERVRFYEQCIDVLAYQWEINNHLEDEALGFLDVEDKKALLRSIAFEMQASAAGLRGNFIAEQELLALTRCWFEENYPDYRGSKAQRAAQQMIQGLWHRNYLLCPRGPRLYGFLHRTFMEYLTATEYVRRFQQTEGFGIDELETLFRQHGNEPEWSEVLRLICGEVGEAYAERLILTLANLKELPKDISFGDNYPFHLVIAIRCMGELRGLARMGSLGSKMLETCVEFVSGVQSPFMQDAFMEREFLPSVIEIGALWPNREQLITHKLDFSKFNRFGHQFYPEFDAALLNDRERTTSFATGQYDHHVGSTWTIRWSAMRALVYWWADDETRRLLIQRSVEDEDESTRFRALELLATRDEWATEETRQLLTKCAINGDRENIRVQALTLLTTREDWANHEVTRAEIRSLFADVGNKRGGSPSTRGWAACRWYSLAHDSDSLAFAKRLVFSQKIDGLAPYLDPYKRLPKRHLGKVARKAMLGERQLVEMIDQMNEELGWDIRKGRSGSQ